MNEAGLNEIKRELQEKIISQIDYSKDTTDDELKDIIDELLIHECKKHHINLQSRELLRKKLFNALRKLDVLQDLVDDTEVTEIMINGPDSIFIERHGAIYKHPMKFESREKLEDVIQQIVSECNRVVNEANPVVDARLDNGARVNVVLSPVALNGPIVTIRRFPDKPIQMEDLIEFGSLSSDIAVFLGALVRSRYNIFISGANRIIGLSQMTFRKQRVQTT